MNFVLKTAVAVVVVMSTSGCVSTQEMPLAPNVVRLDTHAAGLLFTGQARSQTMRRAAEVTLQNGYSHFRLEQAEMSHGSQLAGVYSTSSGFAYGNGDFMTGSATGFATPEYRPTADVGVTVVMFHANEPGAVGAFNAAGVLKKYSQ